MAPWQIPTLFCLFLAIPLIADRVEIRPEGFSQLFLAVCLYLLYLFQEGKLPFRWALVSLTLLELLWVNLHLFFALGLFLIGVYGINSLVNDKAKLKQYALTFMACTAVCFINPSGWRGFVEPFLILREYGYLIAENQSLFFMQARFPDNPVYLHFEGLLFASVLILATLVRRHTPIATMLVPLALLVGFGLFAVNMVRGIPVWGLFFIPLGAGFLRAWGESLSRSTGRLVLRTALVVPIVVMGLGAVSRAAYYRPINELSGIGLLDGVNRSADFIRETGIEGPIFNNYDIGGYAIFHLFPAQRVFVDNRPEAYSVPFFRDIYEPMQENDEAWQAIDDKYGFNCIYFYRHDNTPHAQAFLIRRISDPQWAPVFVDAFTIVLLKRTFANDALIAQFELPRSMFTAVSSE